MDRYDREERDYGRGERDRPRQELPGAPGEFPWQDSGAGDQPQQVWEDATAEPASDTAGIVVPEQQGDADNPLAITGFILSLVMWIALLIPPLGFVLWILAVTFSSIGLRRSRRRGAPHKGLATAGLCISLVGVVFLILLLLLAAGTAIFGE